MAIDHLINSVDVTPSNINKLTVSLDSNKDKFKLESYYRGKYCTRFLSATSEHFLNPDKMWFKKKQLLIFSESGTGDAAIQAVMNGTKNAINQVGLNLDVKYVGVHLLLLSRLNYVEILFLIE